METKTINQNNGKAANANNFTLGQKHFFCLMGIPSELSGKIKPQANKTAVVERKIIAKFNDKQKPIDIYDDVSEKLIKLTGNSDFPLPWNVLFITLSSYQTDITALDTAIKARAAKTITRGDLLRACKLVISDTRNLQNMVQLKLNANTPDEAERICDKAGFDFKSLAVRKARQNAAIASIEPGIILLYGEGHGQHEWQQSEDAGVTFKYIRASSSGESIAEDLVRDKKYWFRCRQVLTKGRFGTRTDWFWGFAP